MVIKKSIAGISCLAVVWTVASAVAASTYVDGFEGYTGRTVHAGGQRFTNPDEPNFTPNGWLDYYQNGIQYDPLAIVASGGPWVETPSGYLDSQGLANFDSSGPPHGVVRPLPGPVPANGTIVFEMKVNVSSTTEGLSYIAIGNSSMGTGVGTDRRAGFNFSGVTNVGKFFDYDFGPEPGLMNEPDFNNIGWIEVKAELDVDGAGAATTLEAFHRAAGSVDPWTSMGTYATSGFTPSHVSVVLAKRATFDDFVITVVPEPATLTVLALGAVSLILVPRRRR